MLNDVWHPWWRATVDGKPAEILSANVIFRAVVGAARQARVRFTFEPFAGALAELKAMLSAAKRVKSRNTMSGALVLWRDGTSRPAQTSAALARLKSMTGVCVQARRVLAAPAEMRHVVVDLGDEHRAQRRERQVAATGGSSVTSSTCRSWSSVSRRSVALPPRTKFKRKVRVAGSNTTSLMSTNGRP